MAHFVLHAHILRSSLTITNSGTILVLLNLRLYIVLNSADDGGTNVATNMEVKHSA